MFRTELTEPEDGGIRLGLTLFSEGLTVGQALGHMIFITYAI